MDVRFESVSKLFGKTKAVDTLNLHIKSGALHFLLGPSGCGKTTTLRMLAGLESLSQGKLFFGDRDVSTLDAADRNIGMVFQNYALWPHMTVHKNIAYGLQLRKLSSDQIKKRIDEVLSITKLETFVDRYPSQLSGGQQQRVALARALAIRPDVLLLDEPLSNLDAKLRVEMRMNITRIHKQTGITTLYVTHDQKEALSMGTEVSIMRAGKLIQTGKPQELYRHPIDPFIAGFIGETNLIDGVVSKLISDRLVLVKTGLGELEATMVHHRFSIGQKVSLSIRPECIFLLDEYKGTQKLSNVVEAQLDHAIYFGKNEQLVFKKDQISFTASHVDTTGREWKEGSFFKLGIDPNNILALDHLNDLSSGT